MQRQNIIVIIDEFGTVECYGNFKKMCEARKFPYHSLKMKKLSFDYEGWKIQRVPFN